MDKLTSWFSRWTALTSRLEYDSQIRSDVDTRIVLWTFSVDTLVSVATFVFLTELLPFPVLTNKVVGAS